MRNRIRSFNLATWTTIVGILLVPRVHAGEGVRIIEAEKCVVTPGHAVAQGFLWASGGGQVHEFWGEQVNDAIQFDLPITTDDPSLKLAVRYSYNLHHYLGFRRRPHSVEGIVMEVDKGKPIPLVLPDTGDWHIYQLVEIPLPALRKGTHRCVLRSTAPGAVRNIDCFVLYNGSKLENPAWLQSSIRYRDPLDRLCVLASPGTQIQDRLPGFIQSVTNAWRFYAGYYGHEAAKPIRLHVIADAQWDNPGATAYQNNAGLFFPEGSFDKDVGNILHELTHYFNRGRLPGWLDEPAVQALTCFVWFPELRPWADPVLRQRSTLGREAASNRASLASVDDVLSVLFVAHGRELFRKFWASVHDAERQQKLAPNAVLDRETIVQHLSRAAGEDVRPVFQRWPGFAQAR